MLHVIQNDCLANTGRCWDALSGHSGRETEMGVYSVQWVPEDCYASPTCQFSADQVLGNC